MKERPILFSAPMVRAILDGRKTQTRRIVKNIGVAPGIGEVLKGSDDASEWPDYCPHGKVGDRLWVRETFHHDANFYEYFYKADSDANVKWRPSIFMPRRASRILLKITNVRVERLQDISEEDAIAEGFASITKDGRTVKYGIPDRDGYPGNDDIGWNWCDWNVSPVMAYKRLWESINGKGSWDINPWVWCLTFRESETVTTVPKTAMERFREIEQECEELKKETPIERLRFFCSLAMHGQDWLDVEQLFDELEALD